VQGRGQATGSRRCVRGQPDRDCRASWFISAFQIIFPLFIFAFAWEDHATFSDYPGSSAMPDDYYSEPPAYFDRPVTAWEEQLAGTLQAIFTSGTRELDGIVAALNKSSVRPPTGEDWTVERFQSVLKDVGW
jgi:hypothetical protein